MRQREIGQEGEEPAYLEYEALTAATAQPTAGTATMAAPAAAADGGSSSGAEPLGLELHRQDGTPLDFSSRNAKQEALRQHKIEEAYNATQAMWGLTSTAGTAHVDAAATSAQPLPSRGRGRMAVRPAWLTRQEATKAMGAR